MTGHKFQTKMGEREMQMIKVENISKVYGTKKSTQKYTALRNISFEVNQGEFIGVMGASGSGKTTLLNILGSIDKPTTGKFIMDGKEIGKLDKNQLARHRMDHIGFIFQDYNLLETMTLRENIILPLSLIGKEVSVIEKKLNQLAGDLGITAVLDKYPYEVSGGEQQRAASCRALINNPKLILADEPTGNLDSKSGKDLLNLLRYINGEYQTTILMVTHDVFAASYCQKILFIRDGEIYNELYAGSDQKQFFDSIIDVMSMLGRGEKMKLTTLALRNIRQNSKKYIMYLFSMGFSVFTVYTFLALMQNDYVKMAFRYDDRYQALLTSFGVIIMVFVLFFLISSNSSFIRARKKEISTYSLFGMTNGRIGLLLFIETMMAGSATLIVGILAGIFFSKLMAMFLLKLSLSNYIGEISFTIDPNAIFITAVLFLTIFAMMGLSGLGVIYRFELVDLFKAEKISEGRYKGSIPVLIVSLILIGTGYFLACSKNPYVVVLGAIPILILVITGTYLFFWGGLPKVLNLIRRKKNYYYRGENMIAASTFFHRMKTIGSVMATIAVLSAVAVTALATGFTLYSNAERNTYSNAGFDLCYYGGETDARDDVHQAFRDHKGKIEDEVFIPLYEANPELEGTALPDSYADEEKIFRIYAESEYNELITHTKTNLQPVTAEQGTCVYLYPFSTEDIEDKMKGKNLNFNGEKIQINDVVRSAVFNFGKIHTVVVSDNDYQRMLANGTIKSAADLGRAQQWTVVLNYKDALVSRELYDAISKVFDGDPLRYRTAYWSYNESLETFGLICFIGFFMSGVFILMTASLLYFKQVMAAEEEAHQFRMLRKIGMDEGTEKKVIRKRLLPVFFIPLIIGIVHSIFAMKTADTVVFSNIISTRFTYLTVLEFSAIMYGVYALVYTAFYLITKNQYSRIVS